MKLNLAEELIRSIRGTRTCPEREDAQERHLPLQSPSFAPIPADTDCASTLEPGWLLGCDPAPPTQQGSCLSWKHRLRLECTYSPLPGWRRKLSCGRGPPNLLAHSAMGV